MLTETGTPNCGFVSSVSNSEQTVFAINADFSGAAEPSQANGLQTNGQFWIGTTATNVGGTHVNVGTLTSTGGTVSITYSTPNINIEASGSSVVGNFVVQTGTSPVTPTSGAVTFNGAVVAAGTHPVRTDGTGAHTMALEVQTSQAIAATDATKIGLAAFNSTYFSVDANGFVGLASGAGAVLTLTGNTGVASPSGGTIDILGNTVAAGGVPIATAASGHQVLIDVQYASAQASSSISNVGLASFNSTYFSVDANGYVTANGSGLGETITGNSGGALSPSSGNWNIVGTGSITTVGSGSTLTVELTGLTQYNVLLGQGSTTIGLAAPSTAGIPLVSNGATSYPSFTTALVVGGGTGNTTFTAYSVICAGTTATGAFQNVSGVGTSGQVLTSNGASALPTWQNGASVLSITSVSHSASPYTVLSTDEFLACQTSTGVITIKLPNAPTTGRVIIIKDSNGDAATSNISVTTVGGTVTVDGQTTYTMVSNYAAISVIFDGSNYEVF